MFTTVKIVTLDDLGRETTVFFDADVTNTLGDIVAAVEKAGPGSVIEAKYVR